MESIPVFAAVAVASGLHGPHIFGEFYYYYLQIYSTNEHLHYLQTWRGGERRTDYIVCILRLLVVFRIAFPIGFHCALVHHS